MAERFPPFLIKLRGKDGPRFYWQPSLSLRAQGWRPRRVPDGWLGFTDPHALELAAVAKAIQLNEEVERARTEAPAQPAPEFPPFLVKRTGAGGLRYYWQPSTKLRALGWRPHRLPHGWSSFTDERELEQAAIAKAREINAELARSRIEEKEIAVPEPLPSNVPVVVDELIQRYYASPEYAKLMPSSRKAYRRDLRAISAALGNARLRDIDRDRAKTFAAAQSPGSQRAKILRLLFGFAVERRWVKVNPALQPASRKTLPSGVPWPAAAVAAFVATADRMGRHSVGTAIMLNEWCGQRPGDVITLGWGAYREGELLVQQSKTGARVVLPIDMVPHLVHRLDEERERQRRWKVVPPTIIASEETGRPYRREEQFREVFASVRAAVAAEHPSFGVDFVMPGRKPTDPDAFIAKTAELQFRHLRHTAVTRLADAGCPDTLIASITGHSHKSVGEIIMHYLSTTKTQARAAFRKRLDAQAAVDGGGKDQIAGKTV